MAWSDEARAAAAEARRRHAGKVSDAKAARAVIKGKASPLFLLGQPRANRLVQLYTSKRASKK